MSREDYIYYARLAEQGERYEDMIKYMKEVSKVRTHRIFPPRTPILTNHAIEWLRAFK